jgi:hypothetical protein
MISHAILINGSYGIGVLPPIFTFVILPVAIRPYILDREMLGSRQAARIFRISGTSSLPNFCNGRRLPHICYKITRSSCSKSQP